MEEPVDVFEQLLEESSFVQKQRAIGEAEGELQALRKTLVNIVVVRYPALTELAQERARHIKQPDVLYELIHMLFIGLDEKSIHAILSNPPTSLSEQAR